MQEMNERDEFFRPLAELFGVKEALIQVIEQLDQCNVALQECTEGTLLYKFNIRKRDYLLRVRDALCEEN